MDASEIETDVFLYKHAKDLVKDLDDAIATQLRKPDGRGGMRLRPWVRYGDVMKKICVTLDMFQELPQLLDPHLPKWIPLLAEIYLEYLQSRHRYKRVRNVSNQLAPLDLVICKILYSFCKVRGEKVIVRFLNVETKYLELLLSAVEDAEQKSAAAKADGSDGAETGVWAWEQRYIALLWLSHLLLAPFDLSTISSADLEEGVVPQIPGFVWPANVPGLTMRVIPLAVKYLASAGKEQDAAKALLVRLAMRRDMQQIGILESLVHWALTSLKSQREKSEALRSAYGYIGVLLFLAGLLRSASETSDLNRYLALIFDTVLVISQGDDDVSKAIMSLGSARKMMLKVIRSLTVLILRQPHRDMKSTELTENAISYFLDSLSDNDTPVRLSASKSLSIITLRLDPYMASQVVDAVLESLNRNLLWTKPSKEQDPLAKPVRDLSAVNPLEWHGLMLTLSHLLYRRSPPAGQLSDILHALLLGLSFEQRGVSGTSIGSNVRDAACFGIWALARRYTTKELLAVPTTSPLSAKPQFSPVSILQVLGTELVTTASLDPEGNIRRGASAALQELIGRHPDTVEQGIGVVQAVDYHAVARRSRAILEVAFNATRLSGQYGEAVIGGILSWRGIGDLDASSRRSAGKAFGILTAQLSDISPSNPFSRFETSIDSVMSRLDQLQKRQIEERHGLLSCFAGVVDMFCELSQEAKTSPANPLLIHKVLGYVAKILQDCATTEYRRPELIAEAASRLVVSTLPLIQVAILGPGSPRSMERGSEVLAPNRRRGYLDIASAFDLSQQSIAEVDALIEKLQDVMPKWLGRNEPETVESASAAGVMLLILSKPQQRHVILEGWAMAPAVRSSGLSSLAHDGYFHALALAQCLAERSGDDGTVCRAFLDRWNADKDIGTKVTLIQSLIHGGVLEDKPQVFLGLLEEGLNDYTTTARGDEGSLVRVQALRAIRVVWENITTRDEEWAAASVRRLIYIVLRLSAEKLDRVRREAKEVVALMLTGRSLEEFQACSFSSKAYFTMLLRLASTDYLQRYALDIARSDPEAWTAGLMAGLVSSADTGNEDLVIVSRAALCEHCTSTATATATVTASSTENLGLVCTALVHNLKTRQGEDRIVVATLETIAFLFQVGIFQQCKGIDLRNLCLQTQKTGYKTGNVRKVLACVKVYGGIASVAAASTREAGGGDEGGGGAGIGAGAREARKRLGAMMGHPWPRVRSAAVDELWSLGIVGGGDDAGEVLEGGKGYGERLLGRDWAAAKQSEIKELVEEMQLT